MQERIQKTDPGEHEESPHTEAEKEQLMKDIVKMRPAIYNHLLHRFKSRDIAEEFTQEGIYRAIRKIDTFKRKAKMKTWVITIAINAALDHIKKNKKMILLSEHGPENELNPPTLHPESGLNSKIQLERVIKALSPSELELLKIIEEREPYAEAAKRMNTTNEGMKKRIFNLRKKILGKFG